MLRKLKALGAPFAIAALVGLQGPSICGAQPNSGDAASAASCPAECQLQTCDWQHDTRVCNRNSDTRACDTCLASAFGRCIQRGNDPVCETSKVTQNAAYATAAASCEAAKAAQNAAYDASHAACELSAARQKASCEVAKAACQARRQSDSPP
jgi:hypothetical protein